MPPPNVTGNLHLGHALSFTLQDTILRSKKMSGYETIWSPGYDHAGIATQVQVEKYLRKLHGKLWSSSDISYDEFVKICHDWSTKRKENISCQIKSIGLNPNWELEYFTLNKSHSSVVERAFIELYRRGKISRDNRIINWSCQLKSALSDIEIEARDIDGDTNVVVPGYKRPVKFGIMHKIAYKLDNDAHQELIVATTRPETIPGDVCLAVHPEDSRYVSFVGRNVVNPVTGARMPVVADGVVDMQLGTGIIKVTPGHNLVDFKIGKRHNLPLINVIDNRGCMENIDCLNLSGVPRFTARDIIIDHLHNEKLYRGNDKKHSMKLPMCSRSGDIVEYMVRPQWFYDIGEACDMAIKEIDKKNIQIQPTGYTGNFLNFLEAREPWCISRQLKWGHSIPSYFYSNDNTLNYFVGTSREAILKQFPSIDSNKLVQDPDVLDTWFSSSLIPLSLGGWPNEMNAFFPSSLLVTGHDIVPLWVCRMMIMSLELVKQLPFHNVLLHGMICDSRGQKMSKSRGNVIDPMQLIGTHLFEQIIPKSDTESFINQPDQKTHNNLVTNMGSDAVRFSLLEHCISGHQVNYDLAKAMLARNFMQKMWQTLRFVYHHWKKETILEKIPTDLHDSYTQFYLNRNKSLNHIHKWMLYHLARLVSVANVAQQTHVYHPLCVGVREFWWNNLCAVFIEWSKCESCPAQDEINLELILLSINTCIHLIHPVIPQITEIMWHSICNGQDNKSLSNEKYPSIEMVNQFENSQLENSALVIKESLDSVTELNYWTKALKLSRTKLKSRDIGWITAKSSESNEDHEIVSRLTGVPIINDQSIAPSFSIYIDKFIQFQISLDLCDCRTQLESGFSSRLKHIHSRKMELEQKLAESQRNDVTVGRQLADVEDLIQLYEDQLKSLKFKYEKIKI